MSHKLSPRRRALLLAALTAALGLALLYWSALHGAAEEEAEPAPTRESDHHESHHHESLAHEHMRAEPPRWPEARAEFERAAAAGSSRAMSYLGWIYETGRGVEVDKATAAEWYARAAGAGAHDYAIKLGWMYLSGDGVAADRARSEQWFRRAIDAGHLPANIALASVLIADALGGKDTARVNEARGLLETALAGDQRLAAFFLARLYIEGIGGHPVDGDLAARYTRIGAEDGNAQMQGWYAIMHRNGDGVPADIQEAAFWAALAAAGGDPVGTALHRELESELTPEQKQAVMQRTLRWAMERRQ